MIAFVEEMIARLFGKQQPQPIRVRADDDNPKDRIFKGRK